LSGLAAGNLAVEGSRRGKISPKVMDFFVYVLIPVAVVFIGFYFGQRKLVFHPSQGVITPAEIGQERFKVVQFQTSDGLTLHAWYQAAAGKATLLMLHGNNGTVASRARPFECYLEHGYGVLLLEYRGYGGNPGTPTEQGVYRDGRAALSYLKQAGVPLEQIVLYGESLGTGIAVQLASEYAVRAVVLQSPYTSMFAVGKYHYPWLPVSQFLHDRFDSISKIGQLHMPIFIVHGAHDRIVPPRMAQQLFAAANPPKEVKYYPEKGHNNLLSPALQQDVLQFLQRHP
jgi:uncharacterized protein